MQGKTGLVRFVLPKLADVTMSDFVQTLAASTVTVPAVEVGVVLILQSFCYLFRVPRVGLLLSCGFVYRLGWWFLYAHYGPAAMPWFTAYVGLGVFLLALAFYGMIHDRA